MADRLILFRRRGAMYALSELEDILVQKIHLKIGESASLTIGAIDSDSARSALPRSQKGIDSNKKVKGVKRNIITDNDGDILEATSTPATFMTPSLHMPSSSCSLLSTPG